MRVGLRLITCEAGTMATLLENDLSGTREQNGGLGGVRVHWRYTLKCTLKLQERHQLRIKHLDRQLVLASRL